MTFRTKFGILTIVVIGLFVYAVYASLQVQASKAKLQSTYDNLVITNNKLGASKIKLQESRDSLEVVMKSLNVWEKSDQEKRERQEKHKKYKLGIEVKANNENYQKLIAYLVGSGFELEYINQKRGLLSQSPRIYFNSDSSHAMAKELRDDLEKRFPNLEKILDDEITKGRTGGPSNLLTIKLRFN